MIKLSLKNVKFADQNLTWASPLSNRVDLTLQGFIIKTNLQNINL